MVNNVRIDLSRREEIILSLVFAAVFGALWGGLFAYGSGYGSELGVLRNNLIIEKGQSISAQSLKEGTSASYIFPPSLYVFEWVEFEVDAYNVSGGVLEINFTRDDEVLRTELVYGSEKILLSGFEQYRLQNSNIDVTLQARDDDVRIGSVYININRGTRQYNPLLGALSFTLFVAIIIIPLIYHKKAQQEPGKQGASIPAQRILLNHDKIF